MEKEKAKAKKLLSIKEQTAKTACKSVCKITLERVIRMDSIVDLSQTAKGNNSTQIGVQNNYTGLSVADATNMAFAMFREYFPQLRAEALADVEAMVKETLSTIPSQLITAPSARTAVPALQNASITEEQDIRELYANLLANSMIEIVKNGVHPGFVEIIKQLSPDEAKILKYMSIQKTIPTVTLRYENENGSGISVINNFSNVGELAQCENKDNPNKYFDNLIRLGLLEASSLSSLSDKSLYNPLKNHPYIQNFATDSMAESSGYKKHVFKEGYMRLTDYGKAFCGICISKTKVVVMEQ